MATQILAVGTTAADSADVVVTTPVTVCLKDAAGPYVASGAHVNVSLKDDAGQYFIVDQMTNGKPAIVISGPGTYRFSRLAGVGCGVFSA